MKFANNKTDSGFVTGNEAFGFQVKNANDADELAKLGTIEVDFSTVTNYNTNGSSTIKAVKGDKSSLNTGRMVGEMNGVNVSTDGQIFATYSTVRQSFLDRSHQQSLLTHQVLPRKVITSTHQHLTQVRQQSRISQLTVAT